MGSIDLYKRDKKGKVWWAEIEYYTTMDYYEIYTIIGQLNGKRNYSKAFPQIEFSKIWKLEALLNTRINHYIKNGYKLSENYGIVDHLDFNEIEQKVW